MKKAIQFLLISQIVLVPLFFLPFANNLFVFNKQSLIISLSALSAFFFLVYCARIGKFFIRRTALDYPILGFLFMYSLCFAFSANRHNSIFSWLTVLSLIISYFLINNLFKKRSVLLKYIILSGVIASIIFLASQFLSFNAIKLQNPMSSQTALSGFLAVTLVLTLSMLFRSKKFLSKWFYIVSALILLFSILVINFKTGWIVLAIGGLVLLSLALSHRQEYEKTARSLIKLNINTSSILISIAICLIALFFVFVDAPKIISTNLPAEVSLSRAPSLHIAVQSALHNVFGYGPNNFKLGFERFRSPDFNKNVLWNVRFEKSANQWFDILTNIGLVGFLSWVALVVLSLFIIFLNSIFLLPVFLSLLALSWYSPFTPSLYLLFFLILAISVKRGRKIEFNLKKSAYSGFFVSAGFIAGIIALVMFLSFIGRVYLANHYLIAKNFNQAIKYNKYDPFYYLVAAKDSMDKAIELAKKNDDKDANQIALFVSRAVSESQTAVDMSKNDSAVWQARAGILEQGKNFIKNADAWIEKAYKQALFLEPNNPYFYQQLGILYERTKDNEKAFSNLRKAIKLRDSMPVAQYELGRMYYNQNSIDQAIEHFQKAIAINPNYANALYSLGLAFQRQKKNSDALSLFEKVLKLNPDNQDVKDKIKQVKSLVKKPKKQETDNKKKEKK